EGAAILGRLRLRQEMNKGFAKKASRTASPVVYRFPDFGIHHLDHGANERPGRIVLAAVAPGIAHILDLGFVEVGEFVLLSLGTEAQLIHVIDDFPEVVSAGDLVLDLPENLADLVFDGIRTAGLLLE